MTTFHTFSSSGVQKKVISACIRNILEHNPNLSSDFNYDTSIWKLLDRLQDLFCTADFSKAPLSQILEDIVAASHNYYHLIPGRRAAELERSANLLLNRAHQALEENNVQQAWSILSAILSAFVPAYWRLRYSLPSFPPVMEAFSLLAGIADHQRETSLHNAIFDFCRDQYYLAPKVDKCNIQVEWLFVMAHYVQSIEQETRLVDMCNNHESPFKDDPDIMLLIGNETLQVLLVMHQRTKSKKALREFIHANLHDDRLRERAFELAMEQHEYGLATELCYDRIINAEEGTTRLYDWYKLLLQAAKKANDIDAILLAAGWLFDNRSDLEHYMVIKQHTDPLKWSEEWPLLLQTARHQKDTTTLLPIYLEEKAWKELEGLLPHLHLYTWLHWEKRLTAECPRLVERYYDIPIWAWAKSRPPGITDKDIFDYLSRMRARFGTGRLVTMASLIKACHPHKKTLHRLLDAVLE